MRNDAVSEHSIIVYNYVTKSRQTSNFRAAGQFARPLREAETDSREPKRPPTPADPYLR